MTQYSPELPASQPGGSPDARASAPVVVVTAPRQTVWWVLTVILAVIATALVTRRDDIFSPAALAQTSGMPQIGARGIYAFTGQLTSRTYGLFMMDVDTGTIWCYEMDRGVNGEPQMKLVAARSWIFDRYLEEFNAADPVPSMVKAMVQQQRSQRAGAPVGGAVTTAPAPTGTK